MKKTILTISVIAGLACGNVMATPTGQNLQTALSTCQTNSSCPTPTGMLFHTDQEAKDFITMGALSVTMWQVKPVMIGGRNLFALVPGQPSP